MICGKAWTFCDCIYLPKWTFALLQNFVAVQFATTKVRRQRLRYYQVVADTIACWDFSQQKRPKKT